MFHTSVLIGFRCLLGAKVTRPSPELLFSIFSQNRAMFTCFYSAEKAAHAFIIIITIIKSFLLYFLYIQI